MSKQKVLSGFAAFFGLSGCVLMLTALCTNKWLENETRSNGLWQNCTGDACDNLKIGLDRIYTNYEMVRGFGVFMVLLACLGTVITIVNVVIRKNIDFSVMATLFMMAALFGLICIALFTSLSSTVPFSWGYSFKLGWAAFPTTLVAGIIMTYIEIKD